MGSSYFSVAMTQCVFLVVVSLILSHVRAAGDAVSSANESISLPPACVIRATLYKTSSSERSQNDFGLPLAIDCSENSSMGMNYFDLGAQRVAGKRHVSLDGYQTPPLGISSYGLEYLDNCVDLESVEIQRFVGDATLKLSCGGALIPNLTAVSFIYNELGTLSGETIQDLPHLKILHLQQNSLRILPENLTDLIIEDTPIQPGVLYLTEGVAKLVNVTITNCQLKGFALQPAHNLDITYLNLSGNAISSLNIRFENGPSTLLTLDLSRNRLEHLNFTWFYRTTSLRSLHLQENHFHSLSLFQVGLISPASIHHIDLRSNELMSFRDTENADVPYWNPQLRISIDGNPWSCQWMLNFSHMHPQLFRLFQYSKYISHININGLSCTPQEPPSEEPPKVRRIMHVRINGTDSAIPVPHPHGNVSSFTVLYGNPVELHRSQRSLALIIVFMLPLGIAFLFLLLYLYLHCERLFHLSYYASGLPCFGGEKSSSGPRFVDHVDIVRYPIANGGSSGPVDVETELPDGYETPVSGGTSICNCTGHRESTCSRTHHVTYESLPAELPYQLYAEIKEQADENGDADEVLALTTGPTAPIYDHLSFVEEMPKLDELRDIS
ncbi:GD23240 [Drosophila simulans]|uniref:GD23240 n=1 Tax=Drosophila simulans TaxID=7240 RepID=B4Q9M0_DROSI|nr:GD23240 [Drosophila simulans]